MSQTRDPRPRRFSAHPGWYGLGGLVVAGWLAVLFGMFWPSGEEARAIDLSAEAIRAAPPLGRTWMGAYQKGRKLGWVGSEVSRRQEGGLLLAQTSQLFISVGGRRQRFDSTMKVELDEQQALERFDFNMQAGPLTARAQGHWTGAALELEAGLGERLVKRSLEMDKAPVFDLTLPAVLVRQDLSAGQRYRVELFDPQSLSQRSTIIEVVGPEALNLGGLMKPVMHFRRTTAGMQVDSWIDAEGRLMKERVAGGLELLAEDEERARAGIEESALDATFLPGVGAVLGEESP